MSYQRKCFTLSMCSHRPVVTLRSPTSLCLSIIVRMLFVNASLTENNCYMTPPPSVWYINRLHRSYLNCHIWLATVHTLPPDVEPYVCYHQNRDKTSGFYSIKLVLSQLSGRLCFPEETHHLSAVARK